MSWIRRRPIFAGVLALWLALMCAGSWLVWEQQRTARVNRSRMIAVETELQVLRGAVPRLEPTTISNMDAELGTALSTLESLRVQFAPRNHDVASAPAVPVERADAYFDIASFVERMRGHAQIHGVELKPDERFGFADYAHAGPASEEIGVVFSERLAMETLLIALFEARPRQLIAVQRERRTGGVARARALESANSATVRADYFDWDARASVRRAGTIDARALRISFVSQTGSLRALLNGLIEFESPLIVRAVEVAPATAFVVNKSTDLELKEATPLVPRSYSRFTVTVELVESAGDGIAGG
jgi:hypothetical protein